MASDQTEPDADEREWNIDYNLVLRIIGTDPNPGEALRSFVTQVVEAALSRAPDAHLAAAKAEALEEAADAWYEHQMQIHGGSEGRRRAMGPRRWLRARAARLREQGGE